MSSFLLDSEVDLIRNEGDDSDIEIIVDSRLDLTGASCCFEIHNRDDETIVAKSTKENGGITIAGQNITVTLNAPDSDGKAGVHRYEFKISTSGGKIYRICRGNFEFLRKIIA